MYIKKEYFKGGGDQAICDFRVYDIGERTAQPTEIQNTQVGYQNKGIVVLFRFQKKKVSDFLEILF